MLFNSARDPAVWTAHMPLNSAIFIHRNLKDCWRAGMAWQMIFHSEQCLHKRRQNFKVKYCLTILDDWTDNQSAANQQRAMRSRWRVISPTLLPAHGPVNQYIATTANLSYPVRTANFPAVCGFLIVTQEHTGKIFGMKHLCLSCNDLRSFRIKPKSFCKSFYPR